MQAVTIPKPTEDIVIISMSDYQEYLRLKKNAEYLEKLDRSFEQLKNGDVVHKTMEELRAME